MSTMRQYKLYSQGSTDCHKLEEVEKPKLRTKTDVLIKVYAISLNARDNQFTTGTYGLPLPEKGVVPISGKSFCGSASSIH
jgi:NADPH:quinone reductase-like Zn-dependent oxidoreductase